MKLLQSCWMRTWLIISKGRRWVDADPCGFTRGSRYGEECISGQCEKSACGITQILSVPHHSTLGSRAELFLHLLCHTVRDICGYHTVHLQSTMQGGIPEGKQSSSETGDDKFEEIVRKIRLITFPFP